MRQYSIASWRYSQIIPNVILKLRIILSGLLNWVVLSSAALADVTTLVPTTVSGGSGTVSTIQADDGISYAAPKGSTVNIGGFTAVGGDISSVVLHVEFSVAAGGYTGTNPIRVNGVSTPIIPTSGDTQRTASVEITAGAFRVNTWPEITKLAVSFINNDGGQGQSVHFDQAYLVITHTTPLFAPPTWSDEFDDSGPPNPARTLLKSWSSTHGATASLATHHCPRTNA